jgi:hypothetical protein
MHALTLLLTAACGPTDPNPGPAPPVYVNEFVASNASGLQDESGAFPDWIEIWNDKNAAADLSGWTLTDDLGVPDKWPFPDGTSIPAGDWLVVFADGDVADGPLHASFKLDAQVGEDIGLFDDHGDPVDQITYATQITDESQARMPDGSNGWQTDPSPTPDATNQ